MNLKHLINFLSKHRGASIQKCIVPVKVCLSLTFLSLEEVSEIINHRLELGQATPFW